jgi:hypothetical protein
MPKIRWPHDVESELRSCLCLGPRVLEDGSLGKRELDHQWKKTAASPVKYADLPRSVASQLLSYCAENGFEVRPEQL